MTYYQYLQMVDGRQKIVVKGGREGGRGGERGGGWGEGERGGGLRMLKRMRFKIQDFQIAIAIAIALFSPPPPLSLPLPTYPPCPLLPPSLYLLSPSSASYLLL